MLFSSTNLSTVKLEAVSSLRFRKLVQNKHIGGYAKKTLLLRSRAKIFLERSLYLSPRFAARITIIANKIRLPWSPRISMASVHQNNIVATYTKSD